MNEKPEWTNVWVWARWMREPAISTAFPQQGDYVDDTPMSQEEYEALRAEWVAAGSPRSGVKMMYERTLPDWNRDYADWAAKVLQDTRG